MKPLISIIMPSYNAAGYLPASVQSVLNQSYVNWELLVVDDGSFDNTQQILKTFHDHRIRIFATSKNLGVSSARNLGLNNSKGEYLAFLDADDIMPKDSLLARFEIFNKFPMTTFVDGKVLTYDSEMNFLKDTWVPEFTGNPLLELMKLSGTCFWGPSWMIKRRPNISYLFNQNLTHGEDLLFYMQLAKSPESLYNYTKEEVMYHRSGHDSAMSRLHALEDGYRKLFQTIKDTSSLNGFHAIRFEKLAKSIMFKSYSRKLMLRSAMMVIFKKW